MNPDLSRRVARVMHTEAILSKGIDFRFELARAVDAADDWNSLPQKYRDVVLAAEREQKIKGAR